MVYFHERIDIVAWFVMVDDATSLLFGQHIDARASRNPKSDSEQFYLTSFFL